MKARSLLKIPYSAPIMRSKKIDLRVLMSQMTMMKTYKDIKEIPISDYFFQPKI